MESGNRNRKCGLFDLFVLLLFVYGVCLPGTSEAGVQLVPRVNTNGEILKNEAGVPIAHESYVLFGTYKHKTDGTGSTQESTATPVIWRVMSADAAQGAGQKKAILLTHYLMDKMAYDGGNDNTWSGSDVQVWVNKETAGGFLEKFSILEKGAMMSPSPDGIPGTKATLPSGSVDNTVGGFNWGDWAIWSYENSDIKSWFGDNDYQSDKGAGVKTYTNARKAHFKGASFIYDTANNGRYYWTRSPVATFANLAWGVSADGSLYDGNVGDSAVAVRPACFLNLESLIFKSASNDLDLSTTSAGEAGSILNPYVLVLPGSPITSVNGWTTTFVSADKTPMSATVSGKTVTLEWNTAITPAVKNWPVSTDFVLSTGQSPISVASAPNSNKALQLTFAADVAPSGLKLSYNLNTDAIVFAQNGTQASVVNSFANLTVTQESPSTPNVIPTQARYDGSSPADLKELLGGAALTAAKAGKLSLTDSTPDGTRIPLGSGDYSIESRNLTIFISFLSKLGDGTHTLYFYNGDVQVGKVTLIVTNSTGGDTKDSGSSGCNAGFGSAGLLAMGIVLLGLNKAGAKKKK